MIAKCSYTAGVCNLAILVGTCHVCPSFGSISLNATEGRIELDSTGLIEITILGRDDTCVAFEFTAFANRTVNFPQGFYSPGSVVAPGFHGSGIDLRNFSLSIDGISIPISSNSLEIFGPSSFILADGPDLMLPSSAGTHAIIRGSVEFEWDFNLYPHGAVGNASPTYTITSAGMGSVELLAIAISDSGPPYFEIQEGNYSLLRFANCEYTSSVPEPASLFIWMLLGLPSRNIRNQKPATAHDFRTAAG